MTRAWPRLLVLAAWDRLRPQRPTGVDATTHALADLAFDAGRLRGSNMLMLPDRYGDVATIRSVLGAPDADAIPAIASRHTAKRGVPASCCDVAPASSPGGPTVRDRDAAGIPHVGWHACVLHGIVGFE